MDKTQDKTASRAKNSQNPPALALSLLYERLVLSRAKLVEIFVATRFVGQTRLEGFNSVPRGRVGPGGTAVADRWNLVQAGGSSGSRTPRDPVVAAVVVVVVEQSYSRPVVIASRVSNVWTTSGSECTRRSCTRWPFGASKRPIWGILRYE